MSCHSQESCLKSKNDLKNKNDLKKSSSNKWISGCRVSLVNSLAAEKTKRDTKQAKINWNTNK